MDAPPELRAAEPPQGGGRSAGNGAVARLVARLPAAVWLAAYEPRWLGPDLLAGLTLAAYAVPVSLAYATLAGLPPEVGLYGYLLGGLGYALLGSSRQLAIGPTSAISLLVGASIAPMAAADPTRLVQVASLAALVVAAMAVTAWALRLSTVTSFISETVLLGFKAGAALSIAATQLPSLFAVAGGGAHFFERIANLVRQVGGLDPLTTALGVGAIALLLLGERLFPGRPVALAVVALSIAVVTLAGLTDRGLATVGALPGGLPSLVSPGLRPSEVDGVLPLAFACFLLSYIESVSAARTFAALHRTPLDVRQELLGLAGANLAVALGQGYPVAGGLSQSAVNDKAGARTPLALVFASLTLALCLLFLTGLVRNLPKAVLAAIVLVAVKGLIDVRGLVRLWRISRFEFRVAVVAFAGVLLLGILKGVVLAAVVSILMLLARAASPHVAFLGRIPGTRSFGDASDPENAPVPGLVAFRVQSSLLYFNVENVLQEVLGHVDRTRPPARMVVCDLSTSPYVDLAGATMLEKLHEELGRRGVELRLVKASASARDILRAEGVAGRVASPDHSFSLAAVVEEFERSEPGRESAAAAAPA